MSHKHFEEDFSDLEIVKEYFTREELDSNPEVQKKKKAVKRSKVVVAILGLVACIVGGAFLLVFAAGNAAEVEAEQAAAIEQEAQAESDNF